MRQTKQQAMSDMYDSLVRLHESLGGANVDLNNLASGFKVLLMCEAEEQERIDLLEQIADLAERRLT